MNSANSVTKIFIIKNIIQTGTVYRVMLLILVMSKGSKEVLTVLIVTHATHVERVESSVCGFYTTLYTE